MAKGAGKTLVFKGRAFVDGGVKETGVRVEDGTIAAISDRDLGPADRVITLERNQVLLPAGLDLLVGMRDWIAAPKETIENATKGALAAGVTVICDQANIVPRLNVLPKLRERVQYVGEKAWCDAGVAGAPPLELADVDHYREAGAYCVGLYSWNLRPWRYPFDLDPSQREFKRYADAGMPGSIIVDEFGFQITPLYEEGETYALEALLRRLDPAWRVRIQVTRPKHVEMILAAKDRLPNILAQVPHHSISIDKDTAYERIGSAARHFPPLRSADEVAKMKELAHEGKIDLLVAFHAPHRMQDKFSAEPIPGELTPKGGYSVVDFCYPHYLTRLGIATACRLYCENPARILGLKKGKIASGYEADLVIFDEDTEGAKEQNLAVSGGFTRGVWKIEPMEFYSLGKVTPFTGERLRFRSVKTFLRGEEAYDRASATHHRVPIRVIKAA